MMHQPQPRSLSEKLAERNALSTHHAESLLDQIVSATPAIHLNMILSPRPATAFEEGLAHEINALRNFGLRKHNHRPQVRSWALSNGLYWYQHERREREQQKAVRAEALALVAGVQTADDVWDIIYHRNTLVRTVALRELEILGKAQRVKALCGCGGGTWEPSI